MHRLSQWSGDLKVGTGAGVSIIGDVFFCFATRAGLVLLKSSMVSGSEGFMVIVAC